MLKFGQIYCTPSHVDVRSGQIVADDFYFILQHVKSYIKIDAELKNLSINDTLNLNDFLEEGEDNVSDDDHDEALDDDEKDSEDYEY